MLAKLGLSAGTTARGGGAGNLDGKTLTIGATGGGVATNITFGDGTNGTVKSLNGLNAQLASNNLQATIDSAGVITISTSNEAAAETIGAIGGTAAGAGYAFNGLVAGAPVEDLRFRRPAPASSVSTTTSFSKSTRRRRTRLSTASIC